MPATRVWRQRRVAQKVQAVVAAADVMMGAHGSVTLFAAALGKRLRDLEVCSVGVLVGYVVSRVWRSRAGGILD